MNKSNEPITIVTGANDQYAMPLSVMIYSIFRNLKTGYNIRFYIIDAGIKKENKSRIKNVLKKNRFGKNHKILFCSNDLWLLKSLPINGRHYAIFSPFLISRILPPECEKVLFVDSDLIIESDISLLWEQDMSNLAIKAVRDFVVQRLSDNDGVPGYRKLGGSDDTPYFNSGVMLINMMLWRKKKIIRRAINYIYKNQDSIRHYDQEALNAVLIHQWEELDPRWNVQSTIFWPHLLPESPFSNQIMEKYNELINEPFIIHYLAVSKPWSYKCLHPLAFHFLFYLKESGWFTVVEWKIWWYKYYYRRCKWLIGDFKDSLFMVNIEE